VTERQGGFVADIEALRAIAITFTLIQHFSWALAWTSPSLGFLLSNLQFWTGVDLFFCISGFVIARSLFRSIEYGKRNGISYWKTIRAFWIRRAFRLLPTAWLWLTIIIVLSIVWNSGGSFKSVAGNIIDACAAILHVENIHKWHCSHSVPDICGVADVYWSLSLEEQFYLFLPLAIAIFGIRGIIPLFAIAAIAQIATPRPAGFELWNVTKSDAIMLGVLLAYCSAQRWYRHLQKPLKVLAPVAVPPLILLLAWLPIQPLYHRVGMISLVSACLVAVASIDANIITRIARPVLLYVGSRSYSWYLAHVPIFLFIRESTLRLLPRDAMNDQLLPLIIATSLGLLVIASELIYRHIEQPLRLYGARIAAQISRPKSVEDPVLPQEDSPVPRDIDVDPASATAGHLKPS